MNFRVLLGVAGIFSLVHGELYSSLAGMQPLLLTQIQLKNDLQLRIKDIQATLHRLLQDAYLLEEETRIASQNPEVYLENPVSAFLLTRRLTAIWRRLNDSSVVGTEKGVNDLATKDLVIPTEKDCEGAARALIRLQKMYNLATEKLANGEINGIISKSKMFASDCLELGREALKEKAFGYAREWLAETLNRNKTDNSIKTPQLLQFLAEINYYQGNKSGALLVAKQLKAHFPNYENADNFLTHFTHAVEQDLKYPWEQQQLETPPTLEPLCRNELSLNNSIQAQLKCRYAHYGRPYLRIGPFKEEEAYIQPRILLYHDVKDGSIDNRVSKTAWLVDGEVYLGPVMRRLEAVTGLTILQSEPLQVVNYGIGGHYIPYVDALFSQQKHENGTVEWHKSSGNRIATFLFYMNDVAQGGSTVFPEVNVTVRPEKGVGVVWYNLLPDGAVDTRTAHSSCPVLLGTKWVCNKWLREEEQVLRRPCGLSPSDWAWS